MFVASSGVAAMARTIMLNNTHGIIKERSNSDPDSSVSAATTTTLLPGEFAVSHFRAFYGTEHAKDQVKDDFISSKTINAVNCASSLNPNKPVYFASDSRLAIETAQRYAAENNYPIVTLYDNTTNDMMDDEQRRQQEPLHLDKDYQWTSGNIRDFYPLFVDFLIMADGKCVSYSKGGFAAYALSVSRDTNCFNYHIKSSHCPAWVTSSSEIGTATKVAPESNT